MQGSISRRQLLKYVGMGSTATLLAACQPKVVEKIVERTVVVTEEKVVEKEVVVKEAVEVEKEVTRVVEKAAAPVTSPKGMVGVSYMMWAGELSEDEINQFQTENPNITLTRLDPDQVRFYAMLAAGNPPDCYRLQAPEFPQLLARALVLNLQDYFEVSQVIDINDLAEANNYYRAHSPLDVGKGDIYGMVKDWSPDCTLWINTTLFEKAQIPAPKDDTPLTYDEVFDLGKRMTQKEGDRTLVWGYCNNDTGWIERYWEVWINAIGSSLFSSDFTKFNLLDNEDAIRAVKFTMDCYEEGISQSPLNPSPRGWPGPDFLAGQIAMMQYGFWYSGMVTGTAAARGMEDDNDAIMVPAPIWGERGKRISTTITATASVVAKATKNPDEAWTAFEWYNGGEPAITRAKGGWGVPGQKKMYAMIPEEDELRQQVKKVLLGEMAYSDHVVRFNPFIRGGEPSAVGAAFANYRERTLQGEFTFDQMIELVQGEVEEAIEEGVSRIM
jgi:multiple sugar transport system substrate-binding protein